MKDSNKIKAYLKGKLTKTEANDFEEKITQDKALQEEVEMQKLEEEALEYLVKKRLKKRINSIRADISNTAKLQPRRRTNWSRYLLAAASIGLLIIGFQFINTTETPQSFAVKEFKEMPFEVSEVRRSAITSKFNTPIFHKNEEKILSNNPVLIDSAIAYFKSVPTTDSLFLVAQYNIGHALLNYRRHEKSILFFDYCYDNAPTDSQLRDKAQYYLLLSYLMTDNTPEARIIFDDLVINNQRFKNRKTLHHFFKNN